jgi:cytochrome P450
MADRDFPHASIIEGIRFTAQVAVPNVVQGLFRRRRKAVAVAGRTGADKLAFGFMSGLRRSYGDGPVWIRVAKDEALLLIGADPIRRALEGSPDPFASDPEPKKSGMSHFQPHALTISRNPEWAARRRFTESVLDGGAAQFSDRFSAIAVEEAAALPAQLDWEAWNRAVRRVARRIILGNRAADDERLSEWLGRLMDKSNPPGSGDESLYKNFVAALGKHVNAAEEGSLASLFAQAPHGEQTDPDGQVIHWLFALGDTLAINALRCLALLAVFDDQRTRALADPAYMDACLHEAMRLWPTTPMLSRETTRAVDWDGVTVPADTQLVIVNSFNHRDRSRHEFADRFAPEEWIVGGAADDWSFNHFSHGPQGCPGLVLSLLVGRTVLATLLRERTVTLLSPQLDPGKALPYSLDYFALRFALAPDGTLSS